MALLHDHARAATLGFVRACVFAIWLAKVVAMPLPFLADLPAAMLRAPGLLGVVPEALWAWVLTPAVLAGLQVILVLAVGWAAVGAAAYRPVALVAALLLTLYMGLACGFTFVSHQELGLLYAAYVLAIFPAADGFAWKRRPRPLPPRPPALYGAALVTLALVILLPYAAIAAYRVSRAAPELFLSDSMAYWMVSLSGVNPDGWSLGLWVLEHPALVTLMQIGFPVTTAFELTAPLALIAPRFRRVWLAVIVPFHLLSWLVLNILFWENLLLIGLLLTDVDRWFGQLEAGVRGALARTRGRLRRAEV